MKRFSSRAAGPVRRLFWRLLLIQLSLASVCMLVAAGIGGRQAAKAALCGAAISILAQAWAGFRALLQPADARPDTLVKAFYRSETGKLLLTAMLFAATFRFAPELITGAMAGYLIIGFFVVQLLSWWLLAIQEARSPQ